MKILIAVDSFKGCMSSFQIANILEKGFKKYINKQNDINKEIYKYVVADGGEGTLDAMILATKGKYISVDSYDPNMNPISSRYGVLPSGEVVIELAETAGLPLAKDKNPMNTTTYGVGIQINDAIKRGYTDFIIGLGGSATNDGGIGILQALGIEFFDHNNKLLENGGGGKQLIEVASIDTSKLNPKLKNCNFTIASDVKNVLFGKNGAAFVFAPQKGATPEMVQFLDDGLKNFAEIVTKTTKNDYSTFEGAGAAGGTTFGLMSFLNCKVESGIEIIISKTNFEKELKNADLVITGEGKFDSQTLSGKAPSVIIQKSKSYGVPVVVICGFSELDEKDIKNTGVNMVFEISNKNISLEENIKNTEQNLYLVSEKILDFYFKNLNRDKKINN